MSLAVVEHGHVVTLDSIAAEVHEQVAIFQRSEADAIEAQLATGRLLAQARHLLPSDQAYGAWRDAQQFGFTRQWANLLARAADNEVEVRAKVETQVSTGRRPNIKAALAAACPPEQRKPVPATEPEEIDAHEPTPPAGDGSRLVRLTEAIRFLSLMPDANDVASTIPPTVYSWNHEGHINEAIEWLTSYRTIQRKRTTQ